MRLIPYAVSCLVLGIFVNASAQAEIRLDCEVTLPLEGNRTTSIELVVDLEQKRVTVPSCLRGLSSGNFCDAQITSETEEKILSDADNLLAKGSTVWTELFRKSGIIGMGIWDKGMKTGRLLLAGKCQIATKLF
jgi:hypothetical protein